MNAYALHLPAILRSRLLIVVALVAMLGLTLLSARPSHAFTLIVTNGNDAGPGSLRQAIFIAAAGDSIVFADDVDTVTLTSEPLVIDKSITIDGGAGVTVARSSAAVTPEFRIFEIVEPDTEVTLANLTITNGVATGMFEAGSGGGIYNADGTLSVMNSTLSSNTAFSGGGIANGSGTLTLNNSTVSGNEALGFGGGLANGGGELTVTNSTVSENESTGSGGGIYNNLGDLTVTGSTLSANTARSGGGINNASGIVVIRDSTLSGNSSTGDGLGGGGGIFNASATLVVINSTLSGNTAQARGGAIHNDSVLGRVSLTNSTVSDNSSVEAYGGISMLEGQLTLANTIVANNSNGDLNLGQFASLTAEGSNIVETAPSGSGPVNGGANIRTTDPQLGLLAANGGPTLTHLPQPGSPAIDTGVNAAAIDNDGGPLANDQRGFERLVGTSVDIGAVEVNAEDSEAPEDGYRICLPFVVR